MRGFVVVIVGALVAVTCLAALAGTAGARSTNGYRALGATVKTFNSDNPSCPGAAPPAQYAYCYKITATKRGRVTAFHVVINARNAYSARKRLALAIAMVPLPTRATKFNSSYCKVVRSSTLGKLIGMQYAAATTTQSGKTTAMRAERSPHC